MSFLSVLSDVFGWIYFAAWSFSFFGQIIENFRRKSVEGLSFDFEVYNLTGFIGYSTYTIWGYVDNVGTGHVSIQDVAFAIHAVFITILTLGQIFVYYNKEDPNQKVSMTCITINIALWWGVFNVLLIERMLGLYDARQSKYFNSIIYLGWCKVFISFIKYTPQVYINWRRKSTEGWSMLNVLLDITGGLFSFAQNLIDYLNDSFSVTPDGQPQSLNIAKYALSFLSIAFDTIFIVQHYCLYRKTSQDRDEEGLVTVVRI